MQLFNEEGGLILDIGVAGRCVDTQLRLAKKAEPRVFRARVDDEWYTFEGDEPKALPKALDDPAWSAELPMPSFAISLTKRQAS